MFETVLRIDNNTNNCSYGLISHFILGIIYFTYLKDIEKCVCVNKELVYNVKKYYIISIVFYFISCFEIYNNATFILILLFIIIVFNIMFVYSVRKLIEQIYRENCKCANTNYTSVINILNAISIGFYIQCIISIIYFIFYCISNKINNETIDINNEDNNEDNNDEEDYIDIRDSDATSDDDDCSNYEEYKKIMRFLEQNGISGGHIDLLAKNALKYDPTQLKNILKTCVKKE